MEFDDDIINEVLGKLHEQNFINDTFYAESYLNQAKFVTFKGPKSVIFDLQKKGISDKVIQTVLEGYSLKEQLENAIQIAQAYLKGQKRVTTKVAKQKVKVFVMQKGYSKEIAEEVVPFLSFEAQNEMEAELAIKEIATIYRRIAKKYEDNELCGYSVTPKFYSEIFSTIGFINRNYKKLDEHARILAIYGTDDKVIDIPYITQIFNILRKKKRRINILENKNGRHESLNETNKYEIYDEILKWLNAKDF